MKKKVSLKDLREFYALTIVTVPTIVIAVISMYITDFVARTISQVLLFFLQAIIVKGMMDNKYE